MIHEMLQKEVIKSIRKGKIKEAIYILEEFIDENRFIRTKFSRALTSISRRLMDLEKTKGKGLIDYEVYDRSKSQLVDDLLFLLDDVDSLSRNDHEIKSTELQTTEIWVVVNGTLEEFDEQKQKDFLDKLGKALKVDDNIKIKQLNSGSVHILLRLPVKEAVRLHKMIKEGEMQDMRIMDAYFGIEQSEISKAEFIELKSEITYLEIGFQLGLRGEEEYKDKFIKKHIMLYEENVKREEEYVKRVESNLKNQLNRLETKLKEKLENLNQRRKSILILEFMMFDSNNIEGSNMELPSAENQYIDNLIDRKNNEVESLYDTIRDLEKRIEITSSKLNDVSEIANENVSGTKAEDLRSKGLYIAEEIEKGFVYGYTRRKINTAANNG
jgi:hypothetical protein